MYMYIYTCVCLLYYIYIYILFLSMHIYIYVLYVYVMNEMLLFQDVLCVCLWHGLRADFGLCHVRAFVCVMRSI